jgi:hypothetical protein
MVSRFSQVAIRGTFKFDFDGEVVVLYTLSDELMREARQLDPTLAADAGTFELLRFDRGGDYVTIIPRNTLPGHDEFLRPRYPRLQTISLEGFDLPRIDGPNDVEAFLEQLPTGFIRDPEYGLGLLKELKPIVSAVEQIDNVRHLAISQTRASEIDKDLYILAYREFEGVRRALGRTHKNALSSAMIDKRILVHNALLNNRLPDQFPEKHRPYKRDTIFKAVSGPSGADKLSSADRRAALAIVSKSKRELAQTDASGLLELRRDIELVTLEQLIERIQALMESKKTEQVWQQFFFDNPFILSLAFSLPIVVFGGGVSVGGRTFTGAGEKIADFLYRNALTDNITLLEIKTPETKVLGSLYRGGIHAPSVELAGTISQVLDQRYQLHRGIALLKESSRVTNVDSYAVKCIVVIGRIPADHNAKKSLELFRNNLNDVIVVTFDELLEKLQHFHALLSTEPK